MRLTRLCARCLSCALESSAAVSPLGWDSIAVGILFLQVQPWRESGCPSCLVGGKEAERWQDLSAAGYTGLKNDHK